MITDCGVAVGAPANVVWEVFSDVERWPEWTASVTRLVALDGPGLAVGKRFEIKQPRMPKLVWGGTEGTTGAAWTRGRQCPGAPPPQAVCPWPATKSSRNPTGAPGSDSSSTNAGRPAPWSGY